DLGSGVFVAWRSRLTHRRLALFPRLDEHTRRIRTDATPALADDGRFGGSRWAATVRCERGVHFRGDARILVNAPRTRDPQQTRSARSQIVHVTAHHSVDSGTKVDDRQKYMRIDSRQIVASHSLRRSLPPPSSLLASSARTNVSSGTCRSSSKNRSWSKIPREALHPQDRASIQGRGVINTDRAAT